MDSLEAEVIEIEAEVVQGCTYGLRHSYGTRLSVHEDNQRRKRFPPSMTIGAVRARLYRLRKKDQVRRLFTFFNSAKHRLQKLREYICGYALEKEEIQQERNYYKGQIDDFKAQNTPGRC